MYTPDSSVYDFSDELAGLFDDFGKTLLDPAGAIEKVTGYVPGYTETKAFIQAAEEQVPGVGTLLDPAGVMTGKTAGSLEPRLLARMPGGGRTPMVRRSRPGEPTIAPEVKIQVTPEGEVEVVAPPQALRPATPYRPTIEQQIEPLPGVVSGLKPDLDRIKGLLAQAAVQRLATHEHSTLVNTSDYRRGVLAELASIKALLPAGQGRRVDKVVRVILGY